ncbi:MAG: FHA domain-containing protein [Deltaproteobacteria bacterium]|nr:FHA domain-containing protein [Deltaproteobacteria bacterium]
MLESLKRLFSPSYRRGLAAEAAGELESAAEHFARAGMPALVLRVRLAHAARQEEPGRRLLLKAQALETAAGSGLDPAELREPRLRLARELLEKGEAEDRRQALALLTAAEALEEAAELHLEDGDFEQARRLLERGRHFERLEAIDRAEAERRSRESRQSEAEAEARACARQGRRREAEERWLALERDEALDPEGRARARKAREALQAERLTGRARLRAEDGRVVILVAGLPAVLGRGEESPLPLADPGVSRRHARLLREGEALWLEDLGSRNGTLIDGVPLAGRLELGPEGRFELGDAVRIRWEVGPPATLELERGLAAGSRCLFLREGEAVSLTRLFPGTGGEAVEDPAVRLRLERGRFLLEGGPALRLDHEPVEGPGAVELADGDELEWPGLRVKVSRT